ncbi:MULTISPECIES: CDP-glycerol glycerophosphotransferase family protein [unclassified Sphingomonas]|uniref:CDP-glycerol glycerophosphotransferase family protein n=1 Tax=unclassified Sphingomonas TaxID=196159 RepID=UPI00226A097B|nr:MULTISPECIES: CDP-glycerol glycerophosphotransferase family protein [unclassified Sphingomonas]
MNIAFLFIAEAYQVYHGAAVALELLQIPGVNVTFYYNDPDVPHHLERIRRAYGAPAVDYVRLARSTKTKAVQTLRVFGLDKEAVLRTNEAQLARYDAVVSLEDTTEILFGGRPAAERPARILIVHGAGDRHVPSMPRRARFDLIIVQGEKMKQRFLDMGIAKPGHITAPGYPKLDTSRRLVDADVPLFANDRPIVLYNPHKVRGLQSWDRFIEPMLRAFAEQDDYNLVVAPHVKMFRRRSERRREQWRSRSTPQILIDPESDRSVDNTYTTAAAIYVGDVSSQVYEFLAEPRPCVFLNPNKVDWPNDPYFKFWHLGDVVERPEDLMDAIAQAPKRHAAYLHRQHDLTRSSLGDTSAKAATRAASDILQFLEKASS